MDKIGWKRNETVNSREAGSPIEELGREKIIVKK